MRRQPLTATLFPYTTLSRSPPPEPPRPAPVVTRPPEPPRPAPAQSKAPEVAAVPRPGQMPAMPAPQPQPRSEEHTSELQSLRHLVCRLLLEKKKRRHHGNRI